MEKNIHTIHSIPKPQNKNKKPSSHATKKWGGECQLNERPNYEKQKIKILGKKEIYIYDKIRLGRERFLKKTQ